MTRPSTVFFAIIIILFVITTGCVREKIGRECNNTIQFIELTNLSTHLPISDHNQNIIRTAIENDTPCISDLVTRIQDKINDPDSQVIYAKDTVQKMALISNSNPYEGNYSAPSYTLTNRSGLCLEKSMLLASILKEMGYGTIISFYPLVGNNCTGVGHVMVGVKIINASNCPSYGRIYYENNDYGIIDTLHPSTICSSDILGPVFEGNCSLSQSYDVMQISDGRAMVSISPKFNLVSFEPLI